MEDKEKQAMIDALKRLNLQIKETNKGLERNRLIINRDFMYTQLVGVMTLTEIIINSGLLENYEIV